MRSRRGNERKGDRLPPSSVFISWLSSLLLLLFLSHCSIFTVALTPTPLPPLFFPTLCTVLDNTCIFNIAASSKLWTYSLAFRVLMKARRVLAPSLFPSTYSRLLSSNPTPPPCILHYLQHPPTPPQRTCPSLLCLLICFPFSVFSIECMYRTDLKPENREMWEKDSKFPQGFPFSSLPPSPLPAKVALCMLSFCNAFLPRSLFKGD